MIPGAMMFWFFIPPWIVGTTILVAIASFAAGSDGALAASGVIFALALWAWKGPSVKENIRCSSAGAWIDLKGPFNARPARIIFDSTDATLDTMKAVAERTEAEVIYADRRALGHIGRAWSMSKLQDYRQTKILDYSAHTKVLPFQDDAPSISFEVNVDAPPELTGPRACDVMKIFWKDGGTKRQLARIIHSRGPHPDYPALPGEYKDKRSRLGRWGDPWFALIIDTVFGRRIM